MRRAVVVGAGVGGLATAGALARTGWSVTLLERSDRLRADPAALLLWPNAVAALRSLGLGGGLDGIATPVPFRGLRRPDGQWLAPQTAVGAGTTPMVAHAEDLHDALIAGLGEHIEIRTGVRIRTVHARPGERPAVGDGRMSWDADLIVAADGADSQLRSRLAPQVMAVSSGYAAWRAVIPWYRAPAVPEEQLQGAETLGGAYRFLAASLGVRGSSGASSRGGIYWTATVAGAARPEPAATQLALLKRWFAGWHAPIGDLLAATEPTDLVQTDGRQLRPMPSELAFPYGSGGFVLLGDAAHAMPHHLAQGAGLALEDAATLRSMVLSATPGPALQSAIAAYSAQRRHRVAQVVRQTQRVGAVLGPHGSLVTRARERAFGALAPRVLDRAATAAADWNPPTT